MAPNLSDKRTGIVLKGLITKGDEDRFHFSDTDPPVVDIIGSQGVRIEAFDVQRIGSDEYELVAAVSFGTNDI